MAELLGSPAMADKVGMLGVVPANVLDVRHPRRALTADEIVKLVESARSSGKRIQSYDGEQRARVYTLSYLTGLRRAELASLTPSSFDLTSERPTVTVQAACSKHRKTDVLPLHPSLVTMLGQWLKGMKKDALLFPLLDRKKTWLMVKKDLERVGIAYETEAGIADFHAAGRHTHITELLRNGASLPEARELARHADIKMTMRYTHIGIEDQAKALKSLPASGLGSGSSGGTEPPTPATSWECLNGRSLSLRVAGWLTRTGNSALDRHCKSRSEDRL